MKISLGPLLQRAGEVRREAARLMRALGETSEKITALTTAPQSQSDDAGRFTKPPREKPR